MCYSQKADFDKALYTLGGLIQGIALDEKVNDDEVVELHNWILVNEQLSAYAPFNNIVARILEIIEDHVITDEDVEDLLWITYKFSEYGKYYDCITATIQTMQGVAYGIIADDKISDEEIALFKEWIDENEFLTGTYPYDDIVKILNSILADGIITENEKEKLKAFLSEFVDTTTSNNLSETDLKELKDAYSVNAICTKNPEIILKDRTFCFTGKSKYASREELAQLVEDCHGSFRNNISSRTNYLIVGLDGSEHWTYSTYGRKIEKAIDLNKTGKGNIQIIQEETFWKVEDENGTPLWQIL